MGVTAVKGKNR